MIEFLIPLKLPVRAAELTGVTESPSARILQERASWGTRPRQNLPKAGEKTSHQSAEIAAQAERLEQERRSLQAAAEQELRVLQEQRTLFQNAAQELNRVSKTVEQQMSSLIREVQEATIELAHAIASKLVFEEIDEDRFPIANLVHEVVSRLESSQAPVVRLHPADLALVQDLSTIGDSNGDKSMQFVADATLVRGDCKAKAGEITVVYELRRQVEEIRRELLSTVSGHAEPRN
ncbi:FliH/SctL family protein [Schlesneria paludicola]|uniref:FliH/SctL family protein n=1 Tax=Schlesneria paludicola TaxID=360056 RepID=UPI00029A4A99|nr:flagellar biosynthesis/type III secretory pathway protein [Schlesneria paludicola]